MNISTTTYNKINLGNTTLIDLTNDTINSNSLYNGLTAHDSTGNIITGTAEITAQGNKLIMPTGLVTQPNDLTTEIEEIQIGTTTYTISPVTDYESGKLINKPNFGTLSFLNEENGISIYLVMPE